ncbi:hypothetical protein Tco_0779110 [Tanacetum coccineum]
MDQDSEEVCGCLLLKKTQRNLLKQQYENFTASSSEVLDQTFDRLQKLISQLEIHGESISQEGWRTIPEIDTLNLDDLYNNLKIYEPEVKGTSSSNTNTQNVAFVSSNSTNSTNGAVNTTHGATTASTQATAINLTTIDNLSDAVICTFFASQPNTPQLDNEDLQQIHPDDLEEMYLRWQMVMLTMRARRFLKNTGRKLIVNGNETIGLHKPAPKTSLAANARRNNEKALNILLSAIPDRHLLSFHDATNAKTLWTAIKARFGGNEASKKMQKNLLKQQFETFTIGSREELDSAYERFQNILIATMIRGQPGLDELEFDDLYNNLKVYEHELKGVSNSNSQNIAFLSTEVKGSTLKQSTVEPAHIPKGYTQAASSTVQTAPNCASHSDKS